MGLFRRKGISMLMAAVLLSVLPAGCTGRGNQQENTNQPKSEKQEHSGLNTEKTVPSVQGGEKKVTFPLTKEVTMTMFAIMNNNLPLDETKAFQKMEEDTNLTWEVQSVGSAELAEKKGLLLSTGQYPDVFMKAGLSQQELDRYGEQGIFLPLNDLIGKYAPNFSKLMEERPAIRDVITSADGNIYSFPMVNPVEPALPAVFVNRPWLEKLGLEEPGNPDELYDMLKAFKEQDPNGNGEADEIPITAYTGNILFSLLPYFGIGYDGATKTALIDGKYQYVQTTDQYKEFIRYIKKLYDDGLLDEQAFSQTADQMKAAAQSGDIYGVIITGGPVMVVGRGKDTDYYILTPFETGVLPITSGTIAGTYAITDKCPYPEEAVAWIDALYTEEGGRLAWMGLEGESYQINADGTWEWILSEEYKDVTSVRTHYTLQGMAQMPVLKPNLWTDGSTDAEDVHITAERKRAVGLGAAQPFPSLKISPDDTKTVATVTADIDPYLEEYFAKVVTGELDLDKSWDSYMEVLDDMGLGRMMEIYTAAYEKSTAK